MLSSPLLKVPLQPVSHDGQEYVKAVVSDQTISVRRAQVRSSSFGPVAFSLLFMRRPLEVESMVGKSLLWHARDLGMALFTLIFEALFAGTGLCAHGEKLHVLAPTGRLSLARRLPPLSSSRLPR